MSSGLLGESTLIPAFSLEEEQEFQEDEQRRRSATAFVRPEERKKTVADAWHSRVSFPIASLGVEGSAGHWMSLRVLLVLVGCLVVLGTGLVVFGICFAAGTSSVALVENDLQSAISTAIQSQINNWLAASYSGLNELGEQLRMRALSGQFQIVDTDAGVMRMVMLPIVRQFVPSLYLGFPTGYFVGFNNIGSVNGSFILTQTDALGAATRTRFETDALGFPLTAIANSNSQFNSSERPWFQKVVRTQKPGFTDIYSFANVDSLGITATFPIFEDLQPPPFFALNAPSDVRASGSIPAVRKIAAVAAADLTLGFLNDFLASLSIGRTGEAFLLDHNGYFIGSSRTDRIGPQFSRVFTHSTQMVDPLVNATMEVVLDFGLTTPINRNNYSDYGRLKDIQGFSVSSDGRSYEGTLRRYDLVGWITVILIPKSDYLDPARNSFFVSLYVALAIVVVATMGFLVFSVIVTRPISQMAKSMEVITKNLDFDEGQHQSGSRLMEIDSMLQSFSRLKYGLQSFSRYVPLSVVRTLMESNSSAVLGVESCVATQFFSDIEGFTTLSETVEPPVLITLLEEYFTEMSEIIFETNGMVIDYFGDAVLASWNAPLLLPGHELKAVRSALMQQRALSRLRLSWGERGMPQLKVRMGLTVGSVLAGNVGSKYRMKYTLMGDSVNLASRLEELNKYYGTYIMISGDLHACVADSFVCRLLDLVSVAGKDETMQVYEVLTERTGQHPGSDETAMLRLESLSVEAFEAFRKREWGKARKLYGEIGGKHGALFVERIEQYEKNPPPEDWNGLTMYDKK